MKPADRSLLWGFVGAHTLLIGLFPFYLSVYLWKLGYSLSQLSWFVALTGFGFLLGMLVWDRIRQQVPGILLVVISLFFELLMVMIVWAHAESFLGMSDGWLFLISFGLVNGLYNGFFWITQRAIFLETVPAGGAGRSFGNLQVLVFVMLKLGIFAGGILLENGGFKWIVAASWLVSLAAVIFFVVQRNRFQFPEVIRREPVVRLSEIRDTQGGLGTEVVFLSDGIFLYLEDFFWLIALFQMATESFFRLGLVVISLAFFFAVGFWLLKNSIDRFSLHRTYRVAVVFYVLSWILQALAISLNSLWWLAVTILSLSFCTSFFRLAFNKRFFDIAHRRTGLKYVLIKSYYSQLGLVVFFALFALVAEQATDFNLWLQGLYLVAALATPMYLWYRLPPLTRD